MSSLPWRRCHLIPIPRRPHGKRQSHHENRHSRGGGPLGVPVGVVGESDADVVIDFSVPDAAVAVTKHCLEFNKPLVIATTGLDASQHEFIRKAAARIPIVWAPSMSTAVNVAMKLTQIAAEALKDLPSGV